MNQRYIDFVPVKAKKPVEKQAITVARTNITEKKIIKETPTQKTAVEEVILETPKEESNIIDTKISKAKYGIIEDYAPVDKFKNPFIHAEVKKRPLSHPSSVRIAKSQVLTKRPVGQTTQKSKKSKKPTEIVKKEPAKVKAPTTKEATFKTPKFPFINTKVEKRPLSKTVYDRRNVASAKEIPSDPVTIIDKTEKDSSLGMIVTVILTIILGAALGTIAFLLLPR